MSESKTVQIFTYPFVTWLRDRVPENLSTYKELQPWALNTTYGEREVIDTNVSIGAQELVVEAGADADARNAVTIHRALRDLTSVQASDPRLWTRLAHIEYWSYMRARWEVERYSSVDKARRFVETRYFVPRSEGRSLIRHGIARLWWGAHLTYDATRSNPYELTDVLFSKLDVAKNILERSMGRSKSVRFAFLDFLKLNSEVLLAPGDVARREVRRLSRFLNLRGGVSVLDCMGEKSLLESMQRELDYAPSKAEAESAEAS